MTDTGPIVVNSSPTQVQIEAGLRQAVLVAGGIAGALGAAKVAGELNTLLAVVGPVAALIAFIWGQIETRKKATKAVAMASLLPNSQATTK